MLTLSFPIIIQIPLYWLTKRWMDQIILYNPLWMSSKYTNLVFRTINESQLRKYEYKTNIVCSPIRKMRHCRVVFNKGGSCNSALSGSVQHKACRFNAILPLSDRVFSRNDVNENPISCRRPRFNLAMCTTPDLLIPHRVFCLIFIRGMRTVSYHPNFSTGRTSRRTRKVYVMSH